MPMALAMQAQDPLSTVQTNYGLYAFTRTPPSRSGRDFRSTPHTKPKPATTLNADRLGANRISPCCTRYPPGKRPDYHQRGKLTSTPSGRTTATDPQQVCPCLQMDLPTNFLVRAPSQETLKRPTWRTCGRILREWWTRADHPTPLHSSIKGNSHPHERDPLAAHLILS